MPIYFKNICDDVANVLSVHYDMKVRGRNLKDLDLLQYINSIEIKETVEGADTATILISDPEFKFIDDEIFVDKAWVWINIYWDSSTYQIEFSGYISAIDVNFQDNGIPQLTITCMDETSWLNREKHSETFYNCTSADVVMWIVSSYGYKVVIDSDYAFPVHETITQSNQTDIEFITKLANDEVHPFTARLVDGVFYYERMGELTTPKLELTYGAYPNDLISFAPQLNKETKQEEINNSTIDTGSKEVSNTTGTVTSNSNNNSNNGSTGTTSSNSSRTYTYDPKTRTWKVNSR